MQKNAKKITQKEIQILIENTIAAMSEGFRSKNDANLAAAEISRIFIDFCIEFDIPPEDLEIKIDPSKN